MEFLRWWYLDLNNKTLVDHLLILNIRFSIFWSGSSVVNKPTANPAIIVFIKLFSLKMEKIFVFETKNKFLIYNQYKERKRCSTRQFQSLFALNCCGLLHIDVFCRVCKRHVLLVKSFECVPEKWKWDYHTSIHLKSSSSYSCINLRIHVYTREHPIRSL